MSTDITGYPSISIEPFEPRHHERAQFSCGVARLDNFLRLTAKKQQKSDYTRVFVAVAEGSKRILGYYAMNSHAVGIAELGSDLLRQVPQRSVLPALYLSMIAVDITQQGKGLGTDLVMDALLRARDVADQVGLKLIILDVINDGGEAVFERRKAFYQRMGFESLPDHPERMFITIDTVRVMFTQYDTSSHKVVREIKDALAEADNGDFASDELVTQTFAKWGVQAI